MVQCPLGGFALTFHKNRTFKWFASAQSILKSKAKNMIAISGFCKYPSHILIPIERHPSMRPYNSKLKNVTTTYSLKILLVSLVVINLLTSCVNPMKTNDGITFVASRGSRPPAQSIVWSPTDEDMILVTAYETMQEPAEVYILDIKTGQKNVLAHQLPARLFEAKWTPDGKRALVLSGGDTIGFETPGWWMVDINNKLSEYLMTPNDAAWSPDGKTIAILREEKKETSIVKIQLVLIDIVTKKEETIATYTEADSTWGMSWSPDGQYVVFSLGQQGASNLYILNMETRQVEKITNNNGSEYPVWSPKGNIIAFERYFPSNTAKTYLHLISSDGECEVEIPNPEKVKVWSPTWSPDGKKLGYIGRDGIYFLEIEKVLGRDIYQSLCQ